MIATGRSDQWVILELSSKAEGEDPDIVRRSIVSSIRGAEVFIPAATTQIGGDRVVHYLVEGYAFVKHKHEQNAYNRLENSKYVQTVLTTVNRPSGGRPVRQLAFVKDTDIDRMKRQIHVETDQGIGVGDMVLITSGAYRQITAKVIEEINEEDKVQIHIQLRSKDSIITLPRSFLQLVTKAPRQPFMDRFEAVKGWFNESIDTCSKVVLWTPKTEGLRESLVRVQCLTAWDSQVGPTASAIYSFFAPLDTDKLRQKALEAGQFTNWVSRWNAAAPIVRAAQYSTKSTSELRERRETLEWLTQMQSRLDTIRAGVSKIEKQMTRSEDGYDNVIIDGLNLAMRVFYAPGMADLRDKKERPSGVIYGFLRSLGALAKRFPGAAIHVCWDGSNDVRKSMFKGYKANRNQNQLGPGGWDQVKWIRETLPSIGVSQAFNLEEEADDVIASLVRGSLKGQRNLILSSDRDLLQLVTEMDHVLTPSQGKKKEAVYDVKLVTSEWGVPPTKMVTLRALLGDNSDTLPGVPTVPEKVLVNLVEMYDTIDGIFSSNLAGLTKLRHDRLRSAEKQVRLNYKVMMLRTIQYQEVLANPNRALAFERLIDVNVDVAPVMRVFFGESTAPTTTTHA